MTIMRRWVVFGGFAGVLGFGAAAVIGGCSSSSEPYPDQNTFCVAKATAECTSGATGGVAAICNVASSDCISARQSACETYANNAISTGQVFNPDGANTCIAAVVAAYTATTDVLSVPYSSIQAIDEACEQETFPGTIQTNGTCTTSAECASTVDGGPQVCTPINGGSSVLRCGSPIPVAAGGQCANFGSVCAAGTYCFGSSTSEYTCANGAAIGASCNAKMGCATGGYCATSAGSDKGVCMQATTQSGAACTSDVSCGGGGSVGSTPTTPFPYCDFSIPPATGSGSGSGSCEQGQGFAAGATDCKAFGAQ
jgi:hypothetical protein